MGCLSDTPRATLRDLAQSDARLYPGLQEELSDTRPATDPSAALLEGDAPASREELKGLSLAALWSLCKARGIKALSKGPVPKQVDALLSHPDGPPLGSVCHFLVLQHWPGLARVGRWAFWCRWAGHLTLALVVESKPAGIATGHQGPLVPNQGIQASGGHSDAHPGFWSRLVPLAPINRSALATQRTAMVCLSQSLIGAEAWLLSLGCPEELSWLLVGPPRRGQQSGSARGPTAAGALRRVKRSVQGWARSSEGLTGLASADAAPGPSATPC